MKPFFPCHVRAPSVAFLVAGASSEWVIWSVNMEAAKLGCHPVLLSRIFSQLLVRPLPASATQKGQWIMPGKQNSQVSDLSGVKWADQALPEGTICYQRRPHWEGAGPHCFEMQGSCQPALHLPLVCGSVLICVKIQIW